MCAAAAAATVIAAAAHPAVAASAPTGEHRLGAGAGLLHVPKQ
jgi:hypothetical protein